MASPYHNPEHPITSFQNLQPGIENANRLTDTTPGSADTLENFFVTESQSLKAVTGYNRLIQRDFHNFCPGNDAYIYRIFTKPLQYSTSISTDSYIYFIAQIRYHQVTSWCTKDTFNIEVVRARVNPSNPQTSDIQHLAYLKQDCAENDGDYYGYKELLADEKIMFFGKNKETFLFDITNNQIIRWHEIPSPSLPTVVPIGIPLATGKAEDPKFTVRVSISYRGTIGRTNVSGQVAMNIAQDTFDWSTNACLQISRPNDYPSQATGWDAYLAIDTLGKSKLYRINDDPIPIGATTVQFYKEEKHFGNPLDFYKFFLDQREPQYNSTIPLQFNEAAFINNRIWITQLSDQDKKYRVYWSGIGFHIFDFSDGSDIGYGHMTIDGGSDNYPLSIVNFRQNDGSPAINVLTGNDGALGKRWSIESRDVTEGDLTVPTFVPIEQVNAWGTYAAESVMTSDNDLYFFSQQGVISTKTKTGTYNVLNNTNISLKIQTIMNSLAVSTQDVLDACYDKTRIIWLCRRKNGSKFLLCYDYVYESYTTLTIPADKIFTVYSDSFTDTTLCFVYEHQLFYVTCMNKPQNELTSQVIFNYQSIMETRVARPFGRILNINIQYEYLEQGVFDIFFEAYQKDNNIFTKHATYSEKEDESPDYFKVYNMYIQLYRDYVITDEFRIGHTSTGIALSLTEYSVTYAQITRDWAKNRSGRAKATLTPN